MPEHRLGLHLSRLQLDVYKDYPINITRILRNVHINLLVQKEEIQLKLKCILKKCFGLP